MFFSPRNSHIYIYAYIDYHIYIHVYTCIYMYMTTYIYICICLPYPMYPGTGSVCYLIYESSSRFWASFRVKQAEFLDISPPSSILEQNIWSNLGWVAYPHFFRAYISSNKPH